MTCTHTLIGLAPVDHWTPDPHWICAACHQRVTDCTHTHQTQTNSGWQCITCHRTLLGPPPQPTGRAR